MTRLAAARPLPLLALLALAAPEARAQSLTPFDSSTFYPSPRAECSLVVGCAEVGEAGSYRVALAFDTASKVLVVREGPAMGGGGSGVGTIEAYAVNVRTNGHLLIAVTVLEGLEVHADVPAVLVQQGGPPAEPWLPTVTSHGLGTPLVGVRWTAWSQRRGAPATLALRLDALPPLGDTSALAGSTGWLLEPRLEAAFWSRDAVFASELGAILRQEPVQLGVDQLHQQLTWALSIAGRTSPVRAELALRGAWSPQGMGLEALLGARLEAGPIEFFGLVGPGFGDAVGTSGVRGMLGVALVGPGSGS